MRWSFGIIVFALACGASQQPVSSNPPVVAAPQPVAPAPPQAPPQAPPLESGSWGATDRGLQCRLVPLGNALIRVELRYDGPPADHPDLAPHLLLTRDVDRNHILKFAVSRDGTELAYVGPKPPGDIGDVEDIVLEKGKTWVREVDLEPLFAWSGSGAYEVVLRFAGWTYETASPVYWTGTIDCTATIDVGSAASR